MDGAHPFAAVMRVGLTAVHVSRMLQRARRQGDLRWSEREIAFHDA